VSIHLSSVDLRIGGTPVLHDVSMDLEARTVAVVGENGSGKSTFARLLGGLVKRASGDLRILGLDVDRNAAELRRRTALVFSNPDAQIIMPTVAEDVAFSLRADRLAASERRDRVAAALAAFGLTALADSSAHDLSGGQKQLLALCGAFVREPDLVIADEPTAYLDARNARVVADHLFAEAGHQLILVTHDLSLARRCEQAVLFDGGRVRSVGEPAVVVAEYEAMLQC
jgi:biotin transport system ATP-binding protein